MRRLMVAMFMASLAAGSASAQIVPALPFNLQNNTVADATQVMANFNQIVNNVNANAAKNGANSDITSLLGLTTPLAPSVGGTTIYVGGTSTGTANAQVVATVVPSTFSLVAGTRVVFKASAANTAAMTLNVAGSGVKDVYRFSQLGVVITAGYEVNANQMVEVIYDGTNYQLLSAGIQLIGEIRDYASVGTVPPPGYLLADASCVSQTAYVGLFAILGLGWGGTSCGGGLFALPDARGRTIVAADGGANRVTAGGSGCTAVLGQGCGAQNQTIAQANLPSVSFTVTDSRTWATTGATFYVQNGAGPGGVGAGANAITAAPVSVVPSGSAPTAASGGSGTALTTLQPTLVVNKIIKY